MDMELVAYTPCPVYALPSIQLYRFYGFWHCPSCIPLQTRNKAIYIYTQSANTLPQYSTMRWLCTLIQCILISNDIVIVFIESSLVEHVGGGQGLAVGRELLRCGGKVAMCEVVQWKGRTLP